MIPVAVPVVVATNSFSATIATTKKEIAEIVSKNSAVISVPIPLSMWEDCLPFTPQNSPVWRCLVLFSNHGFVVLSGMLSMQMMKVADLEDRK